MSSFATIIPHQTSMRTLRGRVAPEQSPTPTAVLVARWDLDETEGSVAADSEGSPGADGTITGAAEYGLESLVNGDAGTSIAFGGGSGVGIEVAHAAKLAIAEPNIIVWAQLDVVPSTNTHFCLFSKDRGSEPGGRSIEVRNQDDAVGVRCYGRTAAGAVVFIGSMGGQGTVEAGTAVRLAFLTNAQDGATLMLDDAVLATDPTYTTGWTANDVSAGIAAFRGGSGLVSALVGVIDRVEIWDGRMSVADVQALPDAVSISREEEPPPDEGDEYITTPEEHGWTDENTVEANSDAMRAAVADASANAGGSENGIGVVELVPSKTYVIRPDSDGNGLQDQHLGAIDITNALQNVAIRTEGKPPLGSELLATLQMESWSGKTGMHNRSVISLHSARNVVLESLKVDGNKTTIGAAGNLANINYANADNGGLSCIAIQGCDGVTLRNVDAFGGLVDSLKLDKEHHATETGYINGDLVRNLLVEDCDFHHSRRMSLAVIAAGNPAGTYNQVVFRRAKFRFAGDDGELPGEAPGSNVDFEPNNSGDKVDGLTFEDCQAENAQGSTYELGSPASLTAGRGWMFDSRSGHVSTKMQFINCTATNNNGGSEGNAFHMFGRAGGSFDDWRIENFTASGNGANLINFLGAAGQTPHWTNFTIINASVSAIFFNSNLPASGHSVTIWRGNFTPTITTNSKTTITINNGFPSGPPSVQAVAPNTDTVSLGARYRAPGWGREGGVVALAGRTSKPMDVLSDPRAVFSGARGAVIFEFRAIGGGSFPGGTWAANSNGDLVFTSDGSTGVKSGEYRMRGTADTFSAWTPIRIEAIARPSGTLYAVEDQAGANDSIKLQNAFAAAFADGGTAVVYSTQGLAKQWILGHDGRYIRWRHPRVRMFDLNIKRITPTYLGGNPATASNYNGLHRRFDSMITGREDDANWTNSATLAQIVNCFFDGNSFDQPICNYSGEGGVPVNTPGNVDSGGSGYPGDPPGSDGFNMQLQFGINMGGTWSAGTNSTVSEVKLCHFQHFCGEGLAYHAGHSATLEYGESHANQRGFVTRLRQGGSLTVRRWFDDGLSQRSDRPFLTPGSTWDTVRNVAGGFDWEPENQTLGYNITIEKCFIETDWDHGKAPAPFTTTYTDVISRKPNTPTMFWAVNKNAFATFTRCTMTSHKPGANQKGSLNMAGTSNNPRGHGTGGRRRFIDCDWYMGCDDRTWAQHGKRYQMLTGTQCGWGFIADSGINYFQEEYIDVRFHRVVPAGISLGQCFALWMFSAVSGLSGQGTDPHVILSGHITFDSGFAQFPFRGSAGAILRITSGTTFAHADFPGATTFWQNFSTVQDQR